MRSTIAAAAAAVLASVAPANPPPARPALMVVGTVHFDNPGLDIANVRVDDVLSASRQREIEAVVDRLARFRPTHVAVEWPATKQDRLDRRYADYRAGRYRLGRDETDQIGLRLAAKLGLPRVDAADWNEDAPGRDSDYDFDTWMKAHGRSDELAAFTVEAKRDAEAESVRNRCMTVGGWLRGLADPVRLAELDAPYYRIATFGDAAGNPGAAWVGAWHARNLRIFANLLRIGGRPGDRTVAVFGAGHASLLKADAGNSGRFSVVDARRYLPPARKVAC